jgi:hypothetical protein
MKHFILALILFLAPCARASQVVLALPTLKTVTQASIIVLPINAKRAYLAITNAGPATAFVQFGTITQYSGQAHTLAYQGFPVISGQTLQWNTPSVPSNSAYGDAQTGSAALTITEGQ